MSASDCYKYDHHEGTFNYTFSSQDSTSHVLVHFQFIGWPDFGVPSSAEKLSDIINQVRAFQNLTLDAGDSTSSIPDTPSVNSSAEFPEYDDQRPLVVHCSAGVGRTGTFITIDSCLRELNATGAVNIQNVVQRIRMQRAFSIQTEEQYSFCYKAVLEYCLRLRKDDEDLCRRIEKCLKNYSRDFY